MRRCINRATTITCRGSGGRLAIPAGSVRGSARSHAQSAHTVSVAESQYFRSTASFTTKRMALVCSDQDHHPLLMSTASHPHLAFLVRPLRHVRFGACERALPLTLPAGMASRPPAPLQVMVVARLMHRRMALVCSNRDHHPLLMSTASHPRLAFLVRRCGMCALRM